MLTELLQRMKEGTINRSVVDVSQRWRLTRRKDELGEMARELFGTVSANRKEIIEKYRPVLAEQGDAQAGRRVFKKICVNCHRIDGEGAQVGPDITDVRNKTREKLLSDILDPNRAVDPRWLDYLAGTKDGRTVGGLMVRQTGDAIVLRGPKGKEETLPRSEIELFRSTGKSLMPEGVEKEVSVDEMADLLAFLKQRGRGERAAAAATSGP